MEPGRVACGPVAVNTKSPSAFPFRQWVRNTCRRAIVWGIGAIALIGGLTWFLRAPGNEPVTRAFGALFLYGALFLASLAKIWWTARGAAVLLEEDALAYQPLHTFWPRRIALDSILACAPKEETRALRFVYQASSQTAREFFLNLAVIEERSRFLTELGEKLEARGLVPVAGARWGWQRPDWSEIEARAL